MSPDVRLVIAGTAYGGWTAITVDRSIETLANAFELKLSERYAGQQATRAIAEGDACRVTIDGTTVITGYVNDVETEYDGSSHEVTVRGRDAAGDLVDCSAFSTDKAWQIGAGSLPQLAAVLLKPFGIPFKVDAGVDVSPTFTLFALQPGETVFDALDRACRKVGVLAVSDGLGGILFTLAGDGAPNTRLVLGRNILRGRFRRSDRQRFSEYVAIQQAPGIESIDPAATSGGMLGVATDAGVKRFRPLLIVDDFLGYGAELPQRRALWEASVRYGRAWRGTFTVRGWRDAAANLWRPNAQVQIVDGFSGLNATLLIAAVRYKLDDQGELAELTLTRREAFLPEPLNTLLDFGNSSVRRVQTPPGIGAGKL